MMVSVSDDRERLRTTFNSAASLYHRARPEYPAALYDELVWLARLRLMREGRLRLVRWHAIGKA